MLVPRARKLVAKYPGLINNTLIPKCATSVLRASNKPSKANLVEQYQPAPGNEIIPPIEEIVAMKPDFLDLKCGKKAFVTFIVPQTLTSNCSLASFSETSSNAPSAE